MKICKFINLIKIIKESKFNFHRQNLFILSILLKNNVRIDTSILDNYLHIDINFKI